MFVEIPYIAPLDPRENATIVRMDISVETLITMGYRITADGVIPGVVPGVIPGVIPGDAIVPADVLIGEDGRAHAVRVLSGIGLNLQEN